MTKKQLIVGKKYNVTLDTGKTYPLYYLEQVEGYDHACDCCGKNTINGFIFCEEFHGAYDEANPKPYENSWDSGVYFVGGSSCLKKFVSEME